MATSKRKPTRIPKLQHHKPTGQAKVVLSGRTFYLGPYGSDEAEVQYRALTTEWLQNGRLLLPEPEEITVTELIAQIRPPHRGVLRRSPCARPSTTPDDLTP